jgi:hypothetical protein
VEHTSSRRGWRHALLVALYLAAAGVGVCAGTFAVDAEGDAVRVSARDVDGGTSCER